MAKSKSNSPKKAKVNALAKVVRSPVFRQRIVESKKSYRRKPKHTKLEGYRYPTLRVA